MIKVYKSNSCVSVSARMKNGTNVRVSFTPITGKGSVFYTDNVRLQEALEKHPKFGRLFFLDGSATQSQSTGQGDDSATQSQSTGENDGEGLTREIKAMCNDDAKDYLAEKYGISRSKLRTRSQIEDAGTEYGIHFVWESAKKGNEDSATGSKGTCDETTCLRTAAQERENETPGRRPAAQDGDGVQADDGER